MKNAVGNEEMKTQLMLALLFFGGRAHRVFEGRRTGGVLEETSGAPFSF